MSGSKKLDGCPARCLAETPGPDAFNFNENHYLAMKCFPESLETTDYESQQWDVVPASELGLPYRTEVLLASE
jgi:hypothetical protein